MPEPEFAAIFRVLEDSWTGRLAPSIKLSALARVSCVREGSFALSQAAELFGVG